MWELDHKESWALKNWCFWTVVLEKTLKSPLDCKDIRTVNPEGNQSWIFIGAEAKAAVLWPPDEKSQIIGEDPDAGKDWGQGSNREWGGWMASLNGHELEQAPGDMRDREASCGWGAKSWTQLSDWTTMEGKNMFFRIRQLDLNLIVKWPKASHLKGNIPLL